MPSILRRPVVVWQGELYQGPALPVCGAASLGPVDRAQLADFLRRRREALLPGDVGFAAGLRRRTQGLRREEVACSPACRPTTTATFVWRWFSDPAARRVYPVDEHPHHSRVQVANLRAAVARRGHDAFAAELVESLRAGSAEFADLWERHEVAVRRMDTKRIVHPELGVIELDCQTFVSESEAQRLLVFTAAPGGHAAEQLEKLARSEGILAPGI
jgi:hypothetical protein